MITRGTKDELFKTKDCPLAAFLYYVENDAFIGLSQNESKSEVYYFVFKNTEKIKTSYEAYKKGTKVEVNAFELFRSYKDLLKFINYEKRNEYR